MNWEAGYTATFYACYIDPRTWNDVERFEITEGSVERTKDNLRQSATLKCTDYDQSTERWVRVYMDAVQSGDVTHTPLFTGLATSPSRDIDGTVIKRELKCYSVLKACEDILLPRGWYVPAGRNAVLAIKSLLEVTPAPVDGDETASPLMQDALIAEDDETNLTMIEKILDAIGWQMQIRGDGTIALSPISVEPVAELSPLAMDIVETSLSVERDWFECPNVFRATLNEMSAVARDDSPDSPLSTVNRGREIWMQDEADLSDNETLAEYAMRKLKEEQAVAEEAKYNRRFLPDVNVGDIVRLDYAQISGDYRVTSQSIDLTYNGTTSEEVEHG